MRFAVLTQRSNYDTKGACSVAQPNQQTGDCFPWLPTPGNGGTTGITVETLTLQNKNKTKQKTACWRRQRTAMESHKKKWQKNLRVILYTRSVSSKTCSLINITMYFTLPFHSTAIAVKLGVLVLFFASGYIQAASCSHVSTEIQQGNTRRVESFLFPLSIDGTCPPISPRSVCHPKILRIYSEAATAQKTQSNWQMRLQRKTRRMKPGSVYNMCITHLRCLLEAPVSKPVDVWVSFHTISEGSWPDQQSQSVLTSWETNA